MSSHEQILLGYLLLGAMGLAALGASFYLVRLKAAELRKRRLIARAGVHFGLIQTITATGQPPAIVNPPSSRIAPRTSPQVKLQDTHAKRWTLPAPTGFKPFQWN